MGEFNVNFGHLKGKCRLLSPNAFFKKKQIRKNRKKKTKGEKERKKKKYSLEKQTELEEFSKGAIKNANQLREHETSSICVHVYDAVVK